ncbi:MAG TPA: alpha/beta family hydrolase [Intrasporangium sp.]|uniref:alpha/beta hydrolase family protein n=1 Tax=Intrasporangium sp. TaxID=1925024 RepID=UPI002D785F86|nr:alpha/beta family hydrolase [Intrasporangium sp.]HET7398317.1 alpha/beta family hydrolase [Intrasporangium sp.]
MRQSLREFQAPGGPGRAHVCRPPHAVGTVVLSHGAGGGIDAVDLAVARDVLTERGWAVVLVEQPWLVAGRRVAGPPPTLDAAWVPIVAALLTGRGRLPRPLVVGGRSAGARVACRTAAALEADAGLLLSFPLHPPGRPDRLRADELAAAPPPTGIVQGERDPFGSPAELAPHLPWGAVVHAVPGAHSFPPSSRAELARAVLDAARRLPSP